MFTFPPGWHLKYISSNDPDRDTDWTCHLWSEEGYVYGYGEALTLAIADAVEKINLGNILHRSAKVVPSDRCSLDDIMGTTAKPINRRGM